VHGHVHAPHAQTGHSSMRVSRHSWPGCCSQRAMRLHGTRRRLAPRSGCVQPLPRCCCGPRPAHATTPGRLLCRCCCRAHTITHLLVLSSSPSLASSEPRRALLYGSVSCWLVRWRTAMVLTTLPTGTAWGSCAASWPHVVVPAALHNHPPRMPAESQPTTKLSKAVETGASNVGGLWCRAPLH
jgi:hypothetical protein